MTQTGDKFSNKNWKKLNNSLDSYSTNTLILIPFKFELEKDLQSNKCDMENKIKNQLTIKKIFNHYYDKLIQKINSKIKKLEDQKDFYDKQYSDLDLNYKSNFEKFNSLLKNMDNTKINVIDLINKAVNDFKEIFLVFKRELEETKSLGKKLEQNFKEKMDDPLFISKNYANLSLYDLNEKFKNNQNKIKQLFKGKVFRIREEFIHKIYEMNLYEQNLEHNFGITNIPKFFLNEFEEIQNEVRSRNIFDLSFKFLMDMIDKELIPQEEKRRAAFQRKRQNNKINHELYSKLLNEFNKQNLFELDNINNNLIFNELNKFKIELMRILGLSTEFKTKDSSPNQNNSYYNKDKNEIESQFDKFKSELANILSNKFNIKKEDNKSIEEMLKKLNENIQINQKFNRDFEFELNQIKVFLEHILTRSFKLKIEGNESKEDMLQKLNENIQMNQFYILELENRNENVKNELKKILSNNFKFKIENDESMEEILKKLNEKTQFNNDFNLDITSSLAQSIFFESTKNKNNSIQQNESIQIQKSEITQSSIQTVMQKYSEQLLFYESLFKYLKNYCEKENKNEQNSLRKENPKTLVEVIDKIIKENRAYKAKFIKYHKKFSNSNN